MKEHVLMESQKSSPNRWSSQRTALCAHRTLSGGPVSEQPCALTEHCQVVQSANSPVRSPNTVRWFGQRTALCAHRLVPRPSKHGACVEGLGTRLVHSPNWWFGKQTALCGDRTASSVSEQPCVVTERAVRSANKPCAVSCLAIV